MLLQRLGKIVGALAQLVEQSRVLDGNDGLRCEVFYKLGLFVRERSYLLAEDDNRSDQVVLLEHRHGKYCPGTGELGELRTGVTRWHIEILRLVQDVSHLNRLLCRQCATERGFWSRSNYWIL